MKHALRNALIPLVTLVALDFGAILGAVVPNRVLLDGMGLYFINALLSGPLSGDGVAGDRRGHDHHLQPDRRHRLRLLDPRVRYDRSAPGRHAHKTARRSPSTRGEHRAPRQRPWQVGSIALQGEPGGPIGAPERWLPRRRPALTYDAGVEPKRAASGSEPASASSATVWPLSASSCCS